MKNQSRNGNARKKTGRTSQRSLEVSITRMARSGDLAKAAACAVRRQRRKRLAITFQRGIDIITRHADGSEEILGQVKPVRYVLPDGVKIIPAPTNGA